MSSWSARRADAEIATVAADWFVRLQEEDASEHDFQAWQRWLAASPEHLRAYRQVEDAWRLIGEVKPTPWASAQEIVSDRGDAVLNVSARATGAAVFSGKAKFLYAAAAAVLVAICLMVAPRYLGRQAPQGYATMTAEQRSVRLPDGSRITLGARTKVVPMFEHGTRKILLESGEAYFEVAHDPSRPFVVIAGGTAVRAVGTAFNVHSTAARTVIGVAEGKVAVVPQAAGAVGAVERLVGSGQEALLTAAGGFELHARSPQEIATWRQGRFEYRGEELRHVIEDLNRYTDRRIVLADESVGALRYSGTVFPDHLDEWLQGIAGALPVQIRDTANERQLARAQ